MFNSNKMIIVEVQKDQYFLSVAIDVDVWIGADHDLIY